jgi:hypothetical protein
MWVHLKTAKGRHALAKPCVARIPLDGCSRTVGTSQRCCAISSLLCDWVLSDGSTCDAPLCADHAHQIGPDTHLCPTHAAQRLREQEEEVAWSAPPMRQGALF